MARRRVFKTKVECPGIVPVRRAAIIGEAVTLRKSPTGSGVHIVLGNAIVGCLDTVVGPQVSSALDRGQLFTAVVEKAYQLDPSANAATWIDLKVEYELDRGQPAIEIPKPPQPEQKGGPRSFYTKIAGVTFRNSDGSSRQRIIRDCRIGEALLLIREPDNPVDKFAVNVVRRNGQQLGYLGRHITREGMQSGITYELDRGQKYLCASPT